MRLKYLFGVIACMFLSLLNAQTFDFGNVTAFEVSETKDDYFQDAPAVILADYYDYLYTLFNEYSIISNSIIVLKKT